MYLPCVGTDDRQLICEDIFVDTEQWCQRHRQCDIVIADDFNADLDGSDNVAQIVSSFINAYSLLRCDDLFPNFTIRTYVNTSLNQESHLDYN